MAGSTVSLRPATIDDIPLILEFLARKAEVDGAPGQLKATEDRLARTLFGEAPQAHIVFAEREGRAVGFASYFYTCSTFLAQLGLWLDDLYVDADCRSQGIGAALLASLARAAAAKGCGRIEWTAAADNARGLAFYRRIGATVRERARLCRLDERAIDALQSR